MTTPIEHHGIIGDMRTAALVTRTGSIDFMCWPRFDSPSIFAALLDDERGGSFELTPELDTPRTRQMYLFDTNVLLTRFLSQDGVAEISDFMVVGWPDGAQRLIRRVKAVRNAVRFRARFAPRFDYARAEHTVHEDAGTLVFTSNGADGTSLRLRASVQLRMAAAEGLADFELLQGQSASFVLEDACHGAAGTAAAPDFTKEAFKATSNYWRQWVARSTYRGRWRDTVTRSSLALKLLTSAEHGSMVAAVTFGLPEAVGGDRNWDYRYTWMRDAAFTVYAFMRLGHHDEASHFMHWLAGVAGRAETGNGRLGVMYRIDGGTDLDEVELPHLRGFRNSAPVRIGNAASRQIQLDVYGEVMDAAYLADKYHEQLSWESWQGITRSIDWVASHWPLPDEGIWEVRSGKQEFLHSRLMCWVALDRAIRLAGKRSLPAPIARWSQERDAITHDIHANFWNPEMQAYVQTKHGDTLDASCLLMPLVRFISPTDPRFLSTLALVEDRLTDDSLIYRYSTEKAADGLRGSEGTFNMCSFWFIECVARAGDLPKARFLFDKMLGYGNHVGLYAEETGPAGEHLGNFPQAFTHLALISAAFALDRALAA